MLFLTFVAVFYSTAYVAACLTVLWQTATGSKSYKMGARAGSRLFLFFVALMWLGARWLA